MSKFDELLYSYKKEKVSKHAWYDLGWKEAEVAAEIDQRYSDAFVEEILNSWDSGVKSYEIELIRHCKRDKDDEYTLGNLKLTIGNTYSTYGTSGYSYFGGTYSVETGEYCRLDLIYPSGFPPLNLYSQDGGTSKEVGSRIEEDKSPHAQVMKKILQVVAEKYPDDIPASIVKGMNEHKAEVEKQQAREDRRNKFLKIFGNRGGRL